MAHQGLQLIGRDGAAEIYEDRGGRNLVLARWLWGKAAGAFVTLLPAQGTYADMQAATDLVGNKGARWTTTDNGLGLATWQTDGTTWRPVDAIWCTGTPEAQITAPIGSIARRTDGGASTTLYVKESGAGNTGWVAK